MNNVEKRREFIKSLDVEQLNTYDKVVVWVMCRNGLKIGKASEELYYHRNSVLRRIERIKEKTGLDLRDFYDAVKLLAMIGEDPQLRKAEEN